MVAAAVFYLKLVFIYTYQHNHSHYWIIHRDRVPQPTNCSHPLSSIPSFSRPYSINKDSNIASETSIFVMDRLTWSKRMLPALFLSTMPLWIETFSYLKLYSTSLAQYVWTERLTTNGRVGFLLPISCLNMHRELSRERYRVGNFFVVREWNRR